MTVPTPAKRGRKPSLTPDLILQVAERRAQGQPHSQIALELGLEVGTSRYAAWVARHGTAQGSVRLELVSESPPHSGASPPRFATGSAEIHA